MTLKMLVSRLSESKNEEEEGVLCLVGFCIGGREGKREGGEEQGRAGDGRT